MLSLPAPEIISGVAELADIGRWCKGWLCAKRAESLSPETIEFYRDKAEVFLAFCASRNVKTLDAIDATLIREWLLDLEAHGHRPGGVSAHYRALKCFLRWYENELDDPAFRNPIRKVKPPKVPETLLDPVDLADVQAMTAACPTDRRGIRDRAILLVLLDTGARAAELCGLDVADFDPATGELAIQKGKGGKGRLVFLGHGSRRAVRGWLKVRGAKPGALFEGHKGQRLKYQGLRRILEIRARLAGLASAPSPHDFRRACAISLLRNGADLLSVSRLLGHSALQVTSRYLKQTSDDLHTAHAANSPVDRAGL